MGQNKPYPAGISRRHLIKSGLGLGLMALPKISLAARRADIVIIGGGVGGLSALRELLKIDPDGRFLSITIIEPNRTYHTAFMSNWVLGDYKKPEEMIWGYDFIENLEQVRLIQDRAIEIDPVGQSIRLSSNTTPIPYDKLILSPGIDYRLDELENIDLSSKYQIVTAYKDDSEIIQLQQQLRQMKEGGVFLVTAPAYPYRCPPAPYERATLAAHWLKKHNPSAKVLIVDNKDSFSMQELFEISWANHFDDMIEYVPAEFAGTVTGLNPDEKGIETEYESFTADVISMIPNQKAGNLAANSGLTDESDWCPVDPTSFRSILAENIFIIGDASYASPMPKSAAAAITQATRTAQVIGHELGLIDEIKSPLSNICWSRTGPDEAIRTGAKYILSEDKLISVDNMVSDTDADAEESLAARIEAETWYKDTTDFLFGG